jgi:uncharacterized hydrophobic protein (TIGR00341 family)
MALRLIEVILPSVSTDRLRELLRDQAVLGVWLADLEANQVIARILVPTGHTERISDMLSDHLGLHPEFRLMLFSVQATLPAVEEPEPEPAAEAPPEEAAEEAEQAEARMQRISREELYQDIAQGAQLSRVYLLTVVLSTLVAAVGLLRSDVAVIIGAMVIAPLLGPNVALALASALGDLKLAARSIKTLLAGVAMAGVLALLVGMVVVVDPQSPEIAARTQVDGSNVVLALAAGSAGALSFTTGIPAAVIGVMVAVALLPPLVVVGLLLGGGAPDLALHAFILFAINIACINLAGVVTFLAQKIRPRTWWESEQAGHATRIAVTLWAVAVALLLAFILLTGQVDGAGG